MADLKFPVKIQFTRPNGTVKVLFVASKKELDGFLRIGWKVVE